MADVMKCLMLGNAGQNLHRLTFPGQLSGDDSQILHRRTLNESKKENQYEIFA